MLGGSFFPFVKNRFYCGKLLTSSDFTEEQKYLNNKRRFLNKIMFGQGVVSGFYTYAIDDTTLMIESGVALDSHGREVVLEKSLVKKLSTIDGFNDIKTGRLGLFVEYCEREINPLYSLARNESGKEYEYNRISEELRFFVKDMQDGETRCSGVDEKFIDSKVLYEDVDFRLRVKVPRFACRDYETNVVACLEKLSDSDLDFSGEWLVYCPGFVCESGDNKVAFKMDKVKLEKGETFELSQSVKFEGTNISDKTTFIVKEGSAKFVVGKNKASVPENVFLTIEIRKSKPLDLVKEQITNLSMEQLLAEDGHSICVAEIELVKVEAKAYVINKVTRPDVYSQIYIPIQQYAIAKMLQFYPKTDSVGGLSPVIESVKPEYDGNVRLVSTFNSVIASGSVEIPITQNIKPGKVIYSDEIMHSLGAGDVFVDVGVEYVLNSKGNNVSRKIVYGDSSVFKDSLPGTIHASKAVKIMCEKGTFVVGIRFDEPANISCVKLKWFAFKTPDFSSVGEEDQSQEKSIYVKKDTLVVVPNEVVCIDVGFNNMGATTLKYDVVDKDGGVVDVYSAPNKEGVYEVRISCTNEPDIYTYAYVIVIKKDV
ncbi:hypothetical protein FACS1894198_1430 [Clostridia bacterium]|nr:hypothetical protein FACS1894198_1430 [Clostridia bacterium]